MADPAESLSSTENNLGSIAADIKRLEQEAQGIETVRKAESSRPDKSLEYHSMDASRLVFVSVKNAKPRRKVAVPIPDGYTWEKFCQQIQTKLKLKGVGSVVLAQSNEQITRLDELQDIDELYVEEAVLAPVIPNGGHQSPGRGDSGAVASSSAGLANGLSHIVEGNTPKARSQRTNTSAMEIEPQPDSEQKYVKRTGGVRRSLQRVLPSLFSPRLPVTTKDVQDDGKVRGAKKKKKKPPFYAPRNLLKLFGLIVFVSGLLYLYSMMVPKLEKT